MRYVPRREQCCTRNKIKLLDRLSHGGCKIKHCLTVVTSSHGGMAEVSPTWNHEIAGSIPGLLAQWVKDPVMP